MMVPMALRDQIQYLVPLRVLAAGLVITAVSAGLAGLAAGLGTLLVMVELALPIKVLLEELIRLDLMPLAIRAVVVVELAVLEVVQAEPPPGLAGLE